MIEEKLVLPNGLTLNYYTAGQGSEVIVLLHGAGADSATMSWVEILPLLAAKGFRVIAPDLPGYGGSDRISGDYSLPFYSSTMAAFIQALDCGPVILAGLSLGGGTALHIALEHEQLLKAMILVDAWGLFDKLPWHRNMHWFFNFRFNQNLYGWAGKYRWIIRWSLTSSLIGDKSKVTDELVDAVMNAVQQPGAGEIFSSFLSSEINSTGVVTNLFDRLQEIHLPTLIVHGEKDWSIPLSGAIEAQKRIAGSELYIMKGCKHWPQKERPQEFTEVLLWFLQAKCFM